NYYTYKFKRPSPENLNGSDTKSKTLELEEGIEKSGNEKINKALKGVGKDLALGVLAGGLGAAIFGRYSFYAGAAISGYGHYTENPALATFGLGMMSSSPMNAAQGVKQNPKASAIENVQERVKAFGLELQRKLLLSRPSPQSEAEQETNLEGVQKSKSNSKPLTEGNRNTTITKPSVTTEKLVPTSDLWPAKTTPEEKTEIPETNMPDEADKKTKEYNDPLSLDIQERIF
ncbi:MAG: hypothetical protein ACXVAU_07725, partial [Mucilaginibacter sp.]